MKISYNWIKEFLPDAKQSPQEIADILTRHIFEVEDIQTIFIDPNIRIVRIEKIEPHPNADHLQLVTITDDIRVVCGAKNISEGDIVPYAPPSAKVRDENGESMTIRETEIRGEKSPGMLASPRELGLSSEHGGIYILPSDTPINSALYDHIPDDTILELDITPNRAHDCMSHLGIARELAALININIVEPQGKELPEPQEKVNGYSLDIKDTPRYMGIILSNVQNKPSPLWMQARLYTVGARPINAIVDVSNYVMFEIGNPSHAFDCNKIEGNIISVRDAQKNELLTLLDGKEISIPEHAQVIDINNTPVALAGIMGGKQAEVSETTTKIILEVANFRAYNIQQTAAAVKIRTEASIRFTKGIDTSITYNTAQRLHALFSEITGAEIQGVLDSNPSVRTPSVIPFNPERPTTLAGMEITPDTAQDILQRLRCTVDASNDDIWNVTVPLDRLDLEGGHDLTEEVIRIVGLDAIPPIPLKEHPIPIPKHIYWREVIRDTLVTLGMIETYNYSFEPADMAKLLKTTEEKHLELTNPIAPEYRYMRISVLLGLMKNLIKNKNYIHKKKTTLERDMFEIGNVYKPDKKGTRVPGVAETQHVAGVVISSHAYDIVSELLKRMNIDNATFEDITLQWASNSQSIRIGDKDIGMIGTLNTHTLKQIKYQLPVTVFELNVDALVKHAPEEPHKQYTLQDIQKTSVENIQYTQISRYPSVMRDISILVESKTSVEEAQEIIERVGGELVVDVDLFDEYEPPEGMKKGIAFHIEYQAQDRTLTDEEINRIHGEIIATLEQDLDAQIR